MSVDRVLISASELAGELSSERPPVVLDVRWNLFGNPGIKEYEAGHIPFAAFVDTDADLAAAPGADGRHPLPEAEAFEAAMRRVGVGARRPVVVYDAATAAAAAARAWWCLRYFGHSNVRVLDGGYAAWTAGAYRIDTGVFQPPAGDFHARPGQMPTLTATTAVRLVERGGALLDARTPERHRGETEPVDPVAGRIPGSHNLPVAELVRPDGRLLDAETLRQRFLDAGASSHIVVGAYCGSGVTAAQTVLAAAVAGIDVSLYAGSWSEWITDSTRPVATGP